MIGESGDTQYIAFMGTKQKRDLVANVNMGQEVLWPEELSSGDVHVSSYPLDYFYH